MPGLSELRMYPFFVSHPFFIHPGGDHELLMNCSSSPAAAFWARRIIGMICFWSCAMLKLVWS
jgi:hypothetical protein